MFSKQSVMEMIIFFKKWLTNITLKCCIPFDYALVLSYHLRNQNISLVGLSKDHLARI